MKKLFVPLLLLIFYTACNEHPQPLVSKEFVDSLLIHFDNSARLDKQQQEIDFWKQRIQSNTPDLVNGSRYAGQLVSRFHLRGNINDVKQADSILTNLAAAFNGKEVNPFMAMASNAILQHRFQKADSFLQVAKAIGVKPYEEAAASFDVNFELGRILLAGNDLKKLKIENDFGYQFRKSKYEHYKGEMDSSIAAMQAAVILAGNSEILKQSALSNLADLYIHAGDLPKAYHTYVDCVKANSSDLHSLMGIGWISLLYDKNDSLAERIFRLVATKTQSPDPLYKLIAVAEQRGDSALQKKYATDFEQKVSNISYGAMYNKYLLQLYTGILNNPAKAERIAFNELQNRNTPQTNAWYVYALLSNGKKDSAYQVYQKRVSGKPLEGLEMYWMGKLMLALDKGYNAQQFFKEADKNKYDLSPSINKDLDRLLK